MDAAILSESAADKEVIKSLLNEVERLQAKFMKIIKTTNGDYYRVRESDKLSPTDVSNEVEKLEGSLDSLKAIAPENTATPPATEQPATAAVETQPAGGSAPVNAAPADQAASQPEDTPAAQPAAPAPPAAEQPSDVPAVLQ